MNLKAARITEGKVGKFKPIIPLESVEQRNVITWCDLQNGPYVLARRVYSIPNGSHKTAATAMKFKREGLRAGYPDLGLDVPRGGFHGLRIEMKRVRGGRLSAEQEDWIVFLLDQGYKAVVCKGADEAIQAIKDYLALPTAQTLDKKQDTGR